MVGEIDALLRGDLLERWREREREREGGRERERERKKKVGVSRIIMH